MQLAEFESAPTEKRHTSYENSMLYTTAPEWSTGEVLLAATYRRLILGIRENDVDLEDIEKARDNMPPSVGGPEIWSRLLMKRGGIQSPLRHGQHSPLASRQLMPIVPSVARIAGVLGKRQRSRWNPSNLLRETIGAGRGQAGGTDLLRDLRNALSVDDRDDVFARFVEEALAQGLQGITPPPDPTGAYANEALGDDSLRAHRGTSQPPRLSPAERFAGDLLPVLNLKGRLTRRQWTVLMESILRLGLGTHVLWTCNANSLIWNLVLSVASGAAPPSPGQIETDVWEIDDESRPLLEVGADSEPVIKRLIERYAYARTGLNLLLCRLEDAGVPWSQSSFIGSASSPAVRAPNAVANFLQHVSIHRGAVDAGDAGAWLRGRVRHLFDESDESKKLRALATCDSGYTKNLFEFARHSLGQVKAKDPEQRCYDLAYLLAYSGERKPLPVNPGPAMLVMLVHACCSSHPSMPVSLDDFRRHLGEYGLHVPAGQLIDGKTGRDLAMLGLVVDTPDAAGGRLLVPPF